MAQQTTSSATSHLLKSCDYETSLLGIGKVCKPIHLIAGRLTESFIFLLGYAAPQNLQNYATYLDTRIRAYRELKHDAIRVQSESNRDLRNSMAIEEGRIEAGEKVYKSSRRRFGGGRKEPVDDGPSLSSNTPQRSKTIAGRKLRVMTVEKGLLRETKVVQKMIDALAECRVSCSELLFSAYR